MGYADDIILLSNQSLDFKHMLKHVSTYENASSSSLSKEKCEIVSFGPNKLDEVGGIKHLKPGNNVRHLGFFLNSTGFINNLTELINKSIPTLEWFKKIYPNFISKQKLSLLSSSISCPHSLLKQRPINSF